MKMFKNREDAAFKLARELDLYRGHNPLILALSGGGTPMGEIIAQELRGTLATVQVERVTAPGTKEVTWGAVNDFGQFVVGFNVDSSGIEKKYLNRRIIEKYRTLQSRRKNYVNAMDRANLSGRVVVMVDDVAKTGSSLLAALQTLRFIKPVRVVLAVAVAPAAMFRYFSPMVHSIVILIESDQYFSPAQYFENFKSIEDREVAGILSGWNKNTLCKISGGSGGR